MGAERSVVVVSSDDVRRETIVRAFRAAGFPTSAAVDITDVDVEAMSGSVDLVLDGPHANLPDYAVADLKRRWPSANVWGISEKAKFLVAWGQDSSEPTPSAESLPCEGVLEHALSNLRSVGGERLVVHERVWRAKRELESIIDGSPDVIFVCSPDDRIVRGNRAFFKKLGKPPTQVLRTHCGEALHGCPEGWPGCLRPEVLEADGAVMGKLDDLPFSGTYECTAFRVDLGEGGVGVVHHLREIESDAAG